MFGIAWYYWFTAELLLVFLGNVYTGADREYCKVRGIRRTPLGLRGWNVCAWISLLCSTACLIFFVMTLMR